MWLVETNVIFHNQLFLFERHKIHMAPKNPPDLFGLIGSRREFNDDGAKISEWTVPVSDILDFLEAWNA